MTVPRPSDESTGRPSTQRTLRQQYDVLRQERDMLIQGQDTIIQDNGVFRRYIERLEKDKEGLQKDKEGLQKDKEGHQKDKEGLQKENERLEKENESLQKENESLQKENESLQEKLQEVEDLVKIQQGIIDQSVFLRPKVRRALTRLGNRATDSASTLQDLTQLENYPHLCRDYLFGTESSIGLESLISLTPYSNVFNDIDARKIRNFLIQVFLFNVDSHDSDSTSYPQANLDSTSKLKFNFAFDIGKPDTTDLDSRLQTGDTFRLSLQLLAKIHNNSQLGQNESIERQFNQFARLSCEVTNLLQPEKLSASKPTITVPEENGGGCLYPEGGWESNGILVAPLVIKKDLHVSRESLRNPEVLVVELKRLDKWFRQLIGYMIFAGCLYGILTNGKTIFFVKLKLEAIQRIMDSQVLEVPDLPVEIQASYYKDVGPSQIQTTLSWNLMMSQELSRFQKQQLEEIRRFYYRPQSESSSFESNLSFQSPQVPSTAPNTDLENKKSPPQIPKIGDGTVELHELPVRAHVYKVPAETVTFFKHNLKPHEFLTVKVFDPTTVEFYGPDITTKELTNIMEREYSWEFQCIQRISKDLQFSNCYFNQDESWVKVKHGTIVVGRCLWSRYIETVPLPINLETYEKVKQQIDILHRNNIFHGDIAARNILYSKEGKVYIIGFSRSIIDPEDKEIFDADYQELVIIFKPCLPKEIVDSVLYYLL